MANESRLSITIDSRSAEQQAKDLEKALSALDDAGIRVVSTTDRASKTTSAAGRTFAAAGREAKQGAGGVDQINRSLEQTDKQAATASATLRRMFLAATAGFSVMGMIDAADSWGQMASRVKQATQSQAEYELVMSRTAVSARETYRSLDEARELFVRTSEAIRGLGNTLEQSIDLTDSFSFLLVTNAASAERGTSAINAYSKAIQTGKVDSESWQSILQAMPTIVDRIAESTGKTAAEIRKLGIEGKLSLGDLNRSLLESLEANRKAAADMPTTVRDAIQNVGNAMKEYIGWQNEAYGATASLAGGLDVLGKNFETIANIVGGVAATALFVYTARTIESTQATIASFAARTRAAKATLDEAQAQAASTAVTLADTRAKLGLTITVAQLTAAEKAHEVALKQVTVAQAGYTRAGMALLGVLGGPVGLGVTLALTAASFLAFKYNTNDASSAAHGLTQQIDALNTSTKELTKNQASQAILDLEAPLSSAQDKVKLLEDNIEGLVLEMKRIPPGSPLFSDFEDALTRARGDLDTANGAVGRLIARMDELRGVASGAALAAAGAAGSFSDEFLKVEAQIKRQIALMGKSGQAAQHRYDLEHGELSKLSDTEKGRLKVSVDSLDASEKAEEARRKAAGAAGKEAKEIDGLLKSLRDQASVLGMTEQQAARYRIETAKGTDAQRKEALALLDKVQAHKAAEQATKLHTESMREQRNLAAEIAVFQNQQNLEITGMGMGDRRRQQLEQEYSIQEEFARRRRELDEAQLTESTRMSDEAYRQQIEYLRSAEEQKIGIIREAADRKLIAEQSWITGAQEGLKNYANEAANAYSQVADFAGNSAKSAEDALVKLFTGAKAGTREMVNSMLADLARLAIRQTVTGPLSSAISGIVGSLFGPSVAPAGVTPGVDWTFPGRANGGPVSAGKMYEVNERGTPELLNIGKRQLLMMGPDGGHVTPLDSGASNKQSSQGGGPVIRIESVVNAAPGTNVAELSAMLDQRDRQLEANIYENMRRGRWNT